MSRKRGFYKIENYKTVYRVTRFEILVDNSNLSLFLNRPTIGVICGSGLAGLGDLLTDLEEIPYKVVGFPKIITINVNSECHDFRKFLISPFQPLPVITRGCYSAS